VNGLKPPPPMPPAGSAKTIRAHWPVTSGWGCVEVKNSMRIEDELLNAAKKAEELSDLLIRAANEIRRLREVERAKLSTAIGTTVGAQEPPPAS
jgi:hypothetical protein